MLPMNARVAVLSRDKGYVAIAPNAYVWERHLAPAGTKAEDWVAVTDRVELTPLLLFVIISLWTPPHFWTLAIFRRADYERAGLRMLPARGAGAWIVACSVSLIALSFLLAVTAGLGLLYTGAAGLLGAGFLSLAVRLNGSQPNRAAWHLYRYSVLYIALLFGMMIIDRLVL